MVKKIKVRKRRIKLEALAILVFLFAAILSVANSLFIKTLSFKYSIAIQEKEAKIAQIRSDNDLIRIEIQGLVNKDRVFEVAEANGLSVKQDNVISLRQGE